VVVVVVVVVFLGPSLQVRPLLLILLFCYVTMEYSKELLDIRGFIVG
jgi:hypothetical protein